MFTEMIYAKDYENLSDDSKVKFDKIIDAVQRMSKSLKDLLNFASLSKEEQFTNVPLNEVIEMVLNDLELLVSQKEASVVVGSLPVIKAISLQMHQLFYNLINNALKFSIPGTKPEVTISFTDLNKELLPANITLDDREYFEIIVKDNGIGFEQMHANKIFNMFQRLHNRQQYGGTGIGLALCRKVLENHGGFIYARSKPGKGTSFHIIIPKE
jgi:signal transduction histidine kinase